MKKLWRYILWQVDVPHSHKHSQSVHLDLGSGRNPRNPFFADQLIALDLELDPRMVLFPANTLKTKVVNSNIAKQLPFIDESIDSVSAFDVLEHVLRVETVNDVVTYPFINLMNEIYRILKPGGVFISLTPAFPSYAAFQHPTHVNFISKGTVDYFCHPGSTSLRDGYNYQGDFELICQHWQIGAGPFEDPKNLVSYKMHDALVKDKILGNLRILWRFAKLFHPLNLKRKRSHLLWVLMKPESKLSSKI